MTSAQTKQNSPRLTKTRVFFWSGNGKKTRIYGHDFLNSPDGEGTREGREGVPFSWFCVRAARQKTREKDIIWWKLRRAFSYPNVVKRYFVSPQWKWERKVLRCRWTMVTVWYWVWKEGLPHTMHAWKRIFWIQCWSGKSISLGRFSLLLALIESWIEERGEANGAGRRSEVNRWIIDDKIRGNWSYCCRFVCQLNIARRNTVLGYYEIYGFRNRQMLRHLIADDTHTFAYTED